MQKIGYFEEHYMAKQPGKTHGKIEKGFCGVPVGFYRYKTQELFEKNARQYIYNVLDDKAQENIDACYEQELRRWALT
jgi:hypothetical protein